MNVMGIELGGAENSIKNFGNISEIFGKRYTKDWYFLSLAIYQNQIQMGKWHNKILGWNVRWRHEPLIYPPVMRNHKRDPFQHVLSTLVCFRIFVVVCVFFARKSDIGSHKSWRSLANNVEAPQQQPISTWSCKYKNKNGMAWEVWSFVHMNDHFEQN